MGGQTGTQQQQTQQTTQLPPWINDAAQQNYGFAQQVAAQPLQQYQGQMVPDTSQQLQQAYNTAATAGNAGIPQFNAATAGYVGALGQTPMSVSAGGPTMQVTDPGNANQITAAQLSSTNLQPYMSPYTQSVINATMPIMQQQLGQTLATNAGNAVNQGAFGGSRFGVQQGTAQAQGALGMTQEAATLNQANFAQAQAAAQGDVAAQNTIATTNQASQQTDLARNFAAQQSNQAANATDLQRQLAAQQSNQTAQQNKINSDIQAAGGLAGTGQNIAQQANNAFGMQNTAGTEQMSQAQDQINAQMAKFQQAFQYPTQQLGILQSALGQTPYGQSTTGASDTTTYTPTDWAALAGAGVGALGNVFGGKLAGVVPGGSSDKRLKKNLQRVGTHGPTKTPIYAYNWKGEPPRSPKHLGPMAQDLAKTVPGSVMQHPVTGHLHVHPVVLGALARPAPAGTLGAMAAGKPTPFTAKRDRSRAPPIRGALGG